MKKFISLFMVFIMVLGASVCTVSAEGVELTITGSKTVLMPEEILTLNMTYPQGETRLSQENEEFDVGRIRMVIDDGEPSLISTKSGVTDYSESFKGSDFGVGTHTIWIYACSTYVKRYDPNGVSFTFTVVAAEEREYLSQDFEGNSFTYDESTYTVTDSEGVMISAVPDRHKTSETDYLDTYYNVLDATGTGADGKALFGYNANSAVNKSANYKYLHYSKVTYDANSLPNEGIIKLSMRYSFPSEYYDEGYTGQPVMVMPFVLTDELGNELIVSRLGNNTATIYYLGGVGFNQQTDGGHYVYKVSSEYDRWYTLDIIYECDTGLASMIWDGKILGANFDIGKLAGETIETATTVTSYRQNCASGLAVDDISITAYAPTSAPEPDPEPVFEIESLNLENADGKVTLSVSYTNTTQDDEPYTAVVAVYNGSSLAGVNIFDGSFLSGSESVTLTHTLEPETSYTTAKGILLESKTSLKPLTDFAQ